ncbi:MAG: hypothetical protein P4M11_02130 [Candidatus Pacebacteria bacterium]|nr:hypothetical protein [Candidatus Paceibacterota bacterium]
MGSQCCCTQSSCKKMTENFNLASGVSAGRKHKHDEPDLLSESTGIRAVNIFTNHLTLLSQGTHFQKTGIHVIPTKGEPAPEQPLEMVSSREEPKLEDPAQPAISERAAHRLHRPAAERGVAAMHFAHSQQIEETKIADLKNGKSSMTIKATLGRKTIVLDPSRFRLERKTSLEDKYEFVSELGRGNFGEVRLVRNKTTLARRALKVISKANCQASENLVEEIEILKHLVRHR